MNGLVYLSIFLIWFFFSINVWLSFICKAHFTNTCIHLICKYVLIYFDGCVIMNKKCKFLILGKKLERKWINKRLIIFFIDQYISIFLVCMSIFYRHSGIENKEYISLFSLVFHYSRSVKRQNDVVDLWNKKKE